MEFRLLGPLQGELNGNPVAVSSGRQRALLAALLLRAGRPVSSDTLVGEVWGAAAPPNARAAATPSTPPATPSRLADPGAPRWPSWTISTTPTPVRCALSCPSSTGVAARQ
jgi:hypothetical protein